MSTTGELDLTEAIIVADDANLRVSSEDVWRVVEAAAPIIERQVRERVADEIADYWRACGGFIDTHNSARLAFDAVDELARGGQDD